MPNCKIILNLYQTLLTAKHTFDASLLSANLKDPQTNKFFKSPITQAVTASQSLKESYSFFETLIFTQYNKEYQETQELFEESFLGCEVIEKAFTLLNNQKLVEFTSQEKAKAKKLLHQFLQEPDIQQFLEKVKKGEINKDIWQLRLNITHITDSKTKQKIPLTMETMQRYLESDIRANNQSRLIYNTGWDYDKQLFFINDTMQFQWVLCTTEVIPVTLQGNNNYQNQTNELKQFANQHNLIFHPTLSRAHPLESLYRFFVRYRGTKGEKRTLENTYDWSAVQLSDGLFVDVGGCGARGARMNRPLPVHGFGPLGSSFSRRSGQSQSLDT